MQSTPSRTTRHRLPGLAAFGRSRLTRIWRAALVACLLALTLGTSAFASIPDGSQVFHGCVVTEPGPRDIGTGLLRLIDTAKSQTCATGELPVSWSQAAVAGPT